MFHRSPWPLRPRDRLHVDLLGRRYAILSVGCSEKAFTVSDAQAKGGMAQWAKVFDAAFRAQSQNALGQAFLLVERDNVLRMDAAAEKNPILLDAYRAACERLPEVARSLVDAGGREAMREFLSHAAESYVACPV